MNKELCLLYANCQGDPLEELLLQSPSFRERYRTERYVNFLSQKIPLDELSRCKLFIYQELGKKWGPLSSEELLKLLPKDCRRIKLPNMFFKGYWPFWTREQRFDFSDFYLNALLAQGLSKSEILYVYLKTDITKKYDIMAIFEESVDRERKKEQSTDLKTVDSVLQRFRSERVFTTINHPSKQFVFENANAILDMTGHERLPKMLLKTMPEPFDDFDLPIHPQVLTFFNISCVPGDMQYKIYGKKKTFEEYVECYVDCKLQGFEHFIGYLQLV